MHLVTVFWQMFKKGINNEQHMLPMPGKELNVTRFTPPTRPFKHKLQEFAKFCLVKNTMPWDILYQ